MKPHLVGFFRSDYSVSRSESEGHSMYWVGVLMVSVAVSEDHRRIMRLLAQLTPKPGFVSEFPEAIARIMASTA